MSDAFLDLCYDKLGKFDQVFDTAGAVTGGADEFFKQLGLLAARIQGEQLTVRGMAGDDIIDGEGQLACFIRTSCAHDGTWKSAA